MAKLLFRLNGVPQDEAQDIRELLDGNRIDYYETSAGRWGISVAAIWLRDESQLAQANELIDRYQQERYRLAREEYEKLKREGRLEGLLDRLRKNPLRILLYLLAIAAVLYLSILPILQLGKT
ncbi:MAG: DUF6164 family protein [Gammaproteobacteria bacterium]|nr:DUF6164 family protein [Gammaproteobacteria bacterium]MCW8841017.1 DUF6164 family protein [Gammaproteobacteria bacterium]MCW8927735.1 DUF6164 family protein [Gammaproteobacteria bacterium]MCW8958832.1 DUF6164 family protein [Gammaproteobacteria bacterium]MCW8972018.1 DUF6164 family protein [Gammaproteobacteria bacterium]